MTGGNYAVRCRTADNARPNANNQVYVAIRKIINEN